ncbi:MAG: alcohol dehydrogenase [Candidatus Methanolliviera sp. GoM_asphalt]|nr:MAG: alcohol dehydrogenase [Candidatus Methanolliviera sp. GoM_asphalt]
MRVAMYYNNRDVRLEEMPTPKIGPDELLVRVIASGICGSDVMEWYRLKRAPLVLGHEIAGEIAAVGEDVKRYRKGDRVFVSHHVPCNTCHYCLNDHHTICDTLHNTNFDPGGFAEYIRVPKINVDRGVFVLPDEVSFDEGVLIEPLACVVRGQRIAHLEHGQSVLVIGSGVAGLLHIQLARSTGAGRVVATDITDYRMKAARRFGADLAMHAEEDVPMLLRQVNDGRGADLVIVCTGATKAVLQAIQSVDRGGTILLFAPAEPGVSIPIQPNDIWSRGITITTTYAGSPKDISIAIELIRNHRIDVRKMITHRLGLAEAGLGFQLVSGADDSLKVIIEPQR